MLQERGKLDEALRISTDEGTVRPPHIARVTSNRRLLRLHQFLDDLRGPTKREGLATYETTCLTTMIGQTRAQAWPWCL